MPLKCKTCGANANSDYCFRHKPRKTMKTGGKFSTLNRPPGASAKKTKEMQELFMAIWTKRQHKSEVSGIPLGKEALSVFFHHILPKEKYPQACLDEENIIILTGAEHGNVEMDMYRYEEVNKRRNYLKTKYNL